MEAGKLILENPELALAPSLGGHGCMASAVFDALAETDPLLIFEYPQYWDAPDEQAAFFAGDGKVLEKTTLGRMAAFPAVRKHIANNPELWEVSIGKYPVLLVIGGYMDVVWALKDKMDLLDGLVFEGKSFREQLAHLNIKNINSEPYDVNTLPMVADPANEAERLGGYWLRSGALVEGLVVEEEPAAEPEDTRDTQARLKWIAIPEDVLLGLESPLETKKIEANSSLANDLGRANQMYQEISQVFQDLKKSNDSAVSVRKMQELSKLDRALAELWPDIHRKARLLLASWPEGAQLADLSPEMVKDIRAIPLVDKWLVWGGLPKHWLELVRIEGDLPREYPMANNDGQEIEPGQWDMLTNTMKRMGAIPRAQTRQEKLKNLMMSAHAVIRMETMRLVASGEITMEDILRLEEKDRNIGLESVKMKLLGEPGSGKSLGSGMLNSQGEKEEIKIKK